MLGIFELEYCVDFIADLKMSVNINWNKMEIKVSITCDRTCASLLTLVTQIKPVTKFNTPLVDTLKTAKDYQKKKKKRDDRSKRVLGKICCRPRLQFRDNRDIVTILDR
jgi:hypothetical protein